MLRMKKWKKISLMIGLFIAAVAIVLGVFIYSFLHPSLPKVKADRIKVAAIGDSITYGVGVLFDRNKSSYPAQLQNMLGDKYQVLNYGLSNRTLQSSGDTPYIKEKQYTVSHEIDPDVVIIMLGTNDSKNKNWNAKNYEKELKAFADSYSSLPSKPKVYLVKPPIASENNSFGIENSVIENEIFDIVGRVAYEEGLKVLDLFSVTKGHPEYFSDGVHPNSKGYMVIAQTINNALMQN
jgi:lysophospholipase L1-like esterase